MSLKAKIDAFAATICKGQVGLAVYRPEPWAKINFCFDNVMEKVRRDGSSPLTGWSFRHHLKPDYGEYLSGTHHCVWLAPDGTPIDITPFQDDPISHPVNQKGNPVFVADLDASPVVVSLNDVQIIAPLPTRYFPMTDDERLIRYLAELTEKERRACEEIYAGRIPEGGAVTR